MKEVVKTVNGRKEEERLRSESAAAYSRYDLKNSAIFQVFLSSMSFE